MNTILFDLSQQVISAARTASPTVSRIASAGLFFLAIFLSGFWLSRSGRPYGMALFTLHKLIAVGAVIFLAVTVSRVHQAAPLDTVQMLAVAFTALCLVAAILTGGLASIAKPMPAVVLSIHHFAPYLTVVSAGVTLYLI